jgi:hypothetical protein
VSKRTVWGVVGGCVLVLSGVGVLAMWPTDRAGYQDTAVHAAEGTLSAVRTLALVGQAELDGKVVDPYVRVVSDRIREAVATPTHDLAAEEVPDAESRALRDELLPLLSTAVAGVGDAAQALERHDRGQIAASVATLQRLGDRLEQFIRRHR